MQILTSAGSLALQKEQKALVDVICNFVASHSMARLSNNNQIACMCMPDVCTIAYVINIYGLKK